MHLINVKKNTAIIHTNDTQDGALDLCKNLELWMTRLPQKLRTIPIIHLAIPGNLKYCFKILNQKEK
jgi:hypothetical protein